MLWVENFQEGLVAYLRDRRWFFLFLIVVLSAGVVAGSALAGTLTGDVQQQLGSYLGGFLRSLGGAEVPASPEILRWSLAQNLRTAGFLWLLGVTVVGFPGVLAVVFMRGLAVGFTVGFLTKELGVRGVVLALAAVLPPNLLVVPAMLVIGCASLSFSLLLFRNRFGHEPMAFYQEIAGYTLLVVATSGLLVGASLVEAFVTPSLVRLAAGLL